MPTIQGFTSAEEAALRKAHLDAKLIINAATNEAFHDNAGFQGRMKKYFSGENATGGWDFVTSLVMKTLSSMKLAVDSDLYRIEKAPQAMAPGTNAAMCSWSQDTNADASKPAQHQGTMVHGGKRKNVIEAQMDHVDQHGASVLTVYPLFFDLPYKAKDAQSQVQSFMHELSHCAAGTVDVDQPKCYGMTGVDYCKKAGKSANNAENIAMFLATYIA